MERRQIIMIAAILVATTADFILEKSFDKAILTGMSFLVGIGIAGWLERE